MFATSPYKEHRQDFNVWALCPAASESGISRPSTGIHRASPLGASYDAFGSERYVLTFDNRALRTVAQFAPYEFIEIITNSRTYGGGGIFNLYSTVAADSEQVAEPIDDLPDLALRAEAVRHSAAAARSS